MTHLTDEIGISGDPRYLAPEVLLFHPPTIASDVYSLGILLWQLRYREIPFPFLENYDVTDSMEQREGAERERREERSGTKEKSGREYVDVRERVIRGERPPLQFYDEYDTICRLCWVTSPSARLTLVEVDQRLRQIARREFPHILRDFPPLSPPLSSSSSLSLSVSLSELHMVSHKTLSGVDLQREKKERLVEEERQREREESEGKAKRPAKALCSVLARRYLWIGCTNGSLTIVDAENPHEFPIVIDEYLLPPTQSAVRSIAYSSKEGGSVWTATNGGQLQVLFSLFSLLAFFSLSFLFSLFLFSF